MTLDLAATMATIRSGLVMAIALLMLSGCGGGDTEDPTASAPTLAVTEQSPEPSPEPEPDTPSVLSNFQVSDDAGYQLDVTMDVTVTNVLADPTNARPGHTELIIRSEANFTVQNITPQRAVRMAPSGTPPQFDALLKVAGEGICGSFNKGAFAAQGGACYIRITDLQNANPQTEAPSFAEIAPDASATATMNDGETRYTIPENRAEEYVEALQNAEVVAAVRKQDAWPNEDSRWLPSTSQVAATVKGSDRVWLVLK